MTKDPILQRELAKIGINHLPALLFVKWVKTNC